MVHYKYINSKTLLTRECALRADTSMLYVVWNITSVYFFDLIVYFTLKIGFAGCNVAAVGVKVRENS